MRKTKAQLLVELDELHQLNQRLDAQVSIHSDQVMRALSQTDRYRELLETTLEELKQLRKERGRCDVDMEAPYAIH